MGVRRADQYGVTDVGWGIVSHIDAAASQQANVLAARKRGANAIILSGLIAHRREPLRKEMLEPISLKAGGQRGSSPVGRFLESRVEIGPWFCGRMLV